MPELDPFEARLSETVHAFADRADTSVDAVAMARLAVLRHRRQSGWLVAARSASVPVALIVALVALLIATGPLGPTDRGFGPGAAPSATASPLPSPTATSSPSLSPTPTDYPDTNGWSLVTGTQRAVVASSGADGAGGHVRGRAISTTDATTDSRADGTGTLSMNLDESTTADVGLEWGTYRLQNAGGTWQGTCSGASWASGQASDLTCWLTGGGGYVGYTYYLHVRSANPSGGEISGAIYRGSPPTGS